MRGDVRASPPIDLRVAAALLLAGETLFLWMFFAADSLSQMALHGRVAGAVVPDFALAASRFAAQWKHGMAGNSPIYMPGFFAVGIPVWLWSIGRPLGRLAAEWVAIAAASTVMAAWLAPIGATHATRSFEQVFGVTVVGPAIGFSPGGVALSLFTLFTWSVTLVGLQLAICKRSLLPLAAPAVLYVYMVELRPWAVNDFTTQWIADVRRVVPVAVMSLLAIPVLVGLLVRYQLRVESGSPARRRAMGEQGQCGPSPTP